MRWLHRMKRLGLVMLVAGLSACGGSDPEPDIVDTARADPRFSILVEAVQAAELDGTLSGTGPFTVFAPTDDAFAALLTELQLSKAQLLANKPLLQQVLQYHMLSGEVLKAAVPLGKAITPLQGGIFKVDARGNDLVVTDGRNRNARITATDIRARNGVIHVVDRVLLPADKTVVATAQATPDLSILVEAVAAAGLVDTLNGNGPFTVFAPTNAAFAKLLVELGATKDQLLANKALLTQVLTYHVVPGRVLKADVPVGAAITTVQGQTFTIDANLGITDARGRRASIVATDVLARNGVIHIVDTVILPRP
ncbi:MAG: fasciclin domain-containing protein [Rubrivivax sp.]|nr:MAG: fasciclin domain-containing protein [Rubrivivax sp.]